MRTIREIKTELEQINERIEEIFDELDKFDGLEKNENLECNFRLLSASQDVLAAAGASIRVRIG